MTRVAIIAALPGELKPLVRNWPSSSRGNIHFWAQRNEEEEWIAACAGASLPPPIKAAPVPSTIDLRCIAPSIASIAMVLPAIRSFAREPARVQR